MSQETHIQELVRSALQGRREAYEQLYRRYRPTVHGVLLSKVPSSVVEDLLQDVFFRAFRKLETLSEPAAFGGWLLTIARNRAVDWHRRRPPTESLEEEPPSTRSIPSAEAIGALRAIRELPEAYRETLMLRLVEGMTGPEIAERCGLTHGSVRVNLHRGMKLLRQKLEGVSEVEHVE